MASRIIYLDNAATTRMKPEVTRAMQPFFEEWYGNPSAGYEFAMHNKKAINGAREKIAQLLNCERSEIYFTSGGTESDNWALTAAAEGLEGKGKHIVTSAVEHHAVLHTCKYLEKRGFSVTYLPVDEHGLVSAERFERALQQDTILASVMFANNEIGTIEPIDTLCKIARERGVLFHTDAVQAVGQIPIDIRALDIDMMSISAHKLYGPKGIGCLFLREGLTIPSFLKGGAQERRLRAGTENIPGIIGFGACCELAQKTLSKRRKQETELRDYLIDRVLDEIPYSRLNGHPSLRLPNNANFCFQFTEGESLLILLDSKGICASSGSACTTGTKNPSHVLTEIGLPEEVARGSLRMTISDETTKEDLDEAVDALKDCVSKVRTMSQEYEEMKAYEKKMRINRVLTEDRS